MNREMAFKIILVLGIVIFIVPLGHLLYSEFVEDDNTPPNEPVFLSPNSGSIDASITTTFSWTSGDPDGNTVTYDIYFGTVNPPPEVATKQSATTYDPGTLDYETTYYWKIIAWDDNGDSTASSVFSFTTEIDTTGDDEDNDNNQQYLHTVFIELGTAGWSRNSPATEEILHEIYSSGDYRFYYVSIVYDENDKAEQRLDEDYNLHAFPTTYIDGGYYVLDETEDNKFDKSDFEDKISAAASRKVPELHIEVDANWDNKTEEFETTVLIENNEDEKYEGRLKVYLTEKISRWYNYDGVPYSFGFLDYIIDKDITIPAGKNISDSRQWPASDLDPDNLMIIAVIFNSKPIKRDSNPSNPNHYHPFDAYYADATAATELTEGENLPPQVGIEYPKKLMINMFGNARLTTPFQKNTILIGRTTVKAYASDDSAIEKVEFYIDENLKETVTQEPYEWTFRKVAFIKHLVRRHTITVTAYDDEGKTSSASIDVIAVLL